LTSRRTATWSPDRPRDTLKTKLRAFTRERDTIRGQLADATTQLDTGRQFLSLTLELLVDPQGFYRCGNKRVKRAMTNLLFTKLRAA
jgi:hypothetical protein